MKVHLDSCFGEKRQIFREFKLDNSLTGTIGREYIANSGGKHRFSLNVRPSEKDQDWLAERAGFEPATPFPRKNHRFLGRNAQLFPKALVAEKVKSN